MQYVTLFYQIPQNFYQSQIPQSSVVVSLHLFIFCQILQSSVDVSLHLYCQILQMLGSMMIQNNNSSVPLNGAPTTA